MNTFRNSYLQPKQENIGQVALGHIRKCHDRSKRRSGEGLPDVPSSNLAHYLARQRGEAQQMQIEAPQVNQPQIAAAAELQNFPISEDPSDDDLLPLKSGNAEVHMESFEFPQKRESVTFLHS